MPLLPHHSSPVWLGLAVHLVIAFIWLQLLVRQSPPGSCDAAIGTLPVWCPTERQAFAASGVLRGDSHAMGIVSRTRTSVVSCSCVQSD